MKLKRDNIIGIRLTESELERFETAAARSELTLSEFARQSIRLVMGLPSMVAIMTESAPSAEVPKIVSKPKTTKG